jgi:thrombospondin type 3 repeat protein
MGAGVLGAWARRIALAVVLCSEVVVLAMSGSASATGREGPGARQAGARDRDGDRLPDRWERRYGLSSHRNSSRGDPDRDSLSNRSEYRLRLNPRRRDTDGDGLSDGREVRTTRTDPRRKDSDGDGVSDGREVAAGSDPRNPLSTPKTLHPAPSPNRHPLPEDHRGLGGISGNPIDPAQQTLLSFGDRSHWLQPWRGYLDTVPATKLRDAVGINIDNMVAVSEVPNLARLLAASGFKRARYEIGWDSIDYDDPSRMRNLGEVRTTLTALRDNGIRPLVLLNSNHGIPCPTRFFDARIVQFAARGARQVVLDSATALAVVPGKTGLNSLTGDVKAADIIFTSVSGDVASLSKPLPRDLSPGTYPAATLRYAPFGPPQLSDGTPNPGFEETLAGWLSYVHVVTRETRNILGNDNFDVEIWNELGFGSDFLYSDRYYAPPLMSGSGDPTYVIPSRTIAWLRDPANGVSGVGIGNGFESQRPWASGATSPLGLTALSKHPYRNMRRFPQDSGNDAPGIRPLDALGRVDGTYDGATNRWSDNFAPIYDAFFPEYYLNAIQTEHFIRDLSPITTDLYGTPHGRFTGPAGGQPPTMWVTEWNMDPSGADPSNPANAGGPPLSRLTDGDVRHMQAKAVLRFLTAWVNKGVSAVHFFAVKQGNLALVDPGFFTALHQGGGAYPGDDLGGETMMAVRGLSAALTGAEPVGQTRSLSLQEIGDYEGRMQFEGDGTAAHPPLYDRDVVAFFPYQVNDHRFVIPVYVMTRNIAKLYRPEAPVGDTTRYDLPDERFRLSIGGLRTSTRIAVRASDPLSGRSIATRVVSHSGDSLVVELPLTDSPRLLTIDELD